MQSKPPNQLLINKTESAGKDIKTKTYFYTYILFWTPIIQMVL